MFVKVFRQILDSTIADDWQVRHVFEDLLKLADYKTGEVDMTPRAISRQTGVPLDVVERALSVLEEPDTDSRSAEEEGRRLVRLAAERSWGWRIVNFAHYRDLKNLDLKREADKFRQQKHRASKRDASVTECDSHAMSQSVAPKEKEEEVKKEENGSPSAPRVSDKSSPLPVSTRAVVPAVRNLKISPPVDSQERPDASLELRILCEAVGCFGMREQRDLHEVMQAHMKLSGVDAAAAREHMTARWNLLGEHSERLQWVWGSSHKFFISGKWNLPESWPWKPGESPPHDPNAKRRNPMAERAQEHFREMDNARLEAERYRAEKNAARGA
ncbi:hypothetical protein [Silvibacterium dinghuense]|uniref:Uncharacterized protein n=1 Tax=Silvibacterium dinghuense TaxID=1560006 RepID=A0A4Q1S9U0_9BACT|nr:hypothetical protein [Silvibacterium dinghuense]RXS93685.1 hypothetical protein ESZ00_16610 [Silvibacterium dinghuense]